PLSQHVGGQAQSLLIFRADESAELGVLFREISGVLPFRREFEDGRCPVEDGHLFRKAESQRMRVIKIDPQHGPGDEFLSKFLLALGILHDFAIELGLLLLFFFFFAGRFFVAGFTGLRDCALFLLPRFFLLAAYPVETRTHDPTSLLRGPDSAAANRNEYAAIADPVVD